MSYLAAAPEIAAVVQNPEVNKSARNLQWILFALILVAVIVFLILFFTIPSCRTCSGCSG
jgi:hypothetical protein